MRQQRIHAEMAANYLSEKQKKQLLMEERGHLDKSEAQLHSQNSNLAFERNQKYYVDKLNNRIINQNKILHNSLSPENRYKNYAMAQQKKDEEIRL